jgi:hypothetical protein
MLAGKVEEPRQRQQDDVSPRRDAPASRDLDDEIPF